MRNFLNRFWNDDAGFIVSAELLFLYTITVLGLLTGMIAVRNAVIKEFVDVANSIQSLNQSFEAPGLQGCKGAFTGESAYQDAAPVALTITGFTGQTQLLGTQSACP